MKDPHETYFHILEAIAVTLMIDRGHVRCCLVLVITQFIDRYKHKQPSNPSLASQSKVQNSTSNLSAYSAQSNSTGLPDQFGHLPQLQRAIINFIISQPPQEEGIHVAAIAKAIGASGEDARKIRWVDATSHLNFLPHRPITVTHWIS